MTEAVWLFDSVGMNASNFVFIDEIDLDAFYGSGRLRVVLLDHNKLAAHQKHLGDAVEEIIDHHNNENLYQETTLHRVVEPVGSATTLVALELLHPETEKCLSLLDAALARLLMGPILLDTINFASDAVRFNEKDTRAFDELKQLAGSDYSAQVLFDKLQEEKFNVASLSSYDLLRKDYKKFYFKTSGARALLAIFFPILQAFSAESSRTLNRRTELNHLGDKLCESVYRNMD